MGSSIAASQPSASGLSLPLTFETLEQIQDMNNTRLKTGPMVNVIGFVKDYQPPIQTRGTDFKCTVKLIDNSIPPDSPGMNVNIFWPQDQMPKISGVSDLVIIRNAKAQMYGGSVSLLANYASEFHFLPAADIPHNPSAASAAAWKSTPRSNRPSLLETRYALWAISCIDELCLPTSQEFRDNSAQAMTVRDKFSLLKDIKPGNYYNILGRVIKVFDGPSGSLTMYLSDYTPNSYFYDHVWGEGENRDTSSSREGDRYGYTKSRPKSIKAWPGPYGKLSIQLTLFDEQANFVRENVKVEQWVLLTNVLVQFGKQGGCLEGFLHGERCGVFQGKIHVRVMEQAEEDDDNDKRWKEAIRRCHEWSKNFEKRKKQIFDERIGLGDKRKAGYDESLKLNSKTRRLQKRAAAEQKAAAIEANSMKKLDLNDNVVCSYPDQPTLPLAQILKPQTISLMVANTCRKYVSPFSVSKFKAKVRVVDYFPPKIEDFAVGRRVSEFDMLSDYSGGENTDLEEEMKSYRSGKGFAKRNWEWRFALKIQDASNQSANDRIWLMVDNPAAQGLLNLDAANLREDDELLHDVKEKLFQLWGDLEEQKSALAQKQLPKKTTTPPPSSLQTQSSVSTPRRPAGAQPDADSESENEQPPAILSSNRAEPPVLQERSSNSLVVIPSSDTCTSPEGQGTLEPRNKAFLCCIQQYGIKIREDDYSKADAGVGKRWGRRFGLFGTYIK